jgi:hypothetical protein
MTDFRLSWQFAFDVDVLEGCAASIFRVEIYRMSFSVNLCMCIHTSINKSFIDLSMNFC